MGNVNCTGYDASLTLGIAECRTKSPNYDEHDGMGIGRHSKPPGDRVLFLALWKLPGEQA